MVAKKVSSNKGEDATEELSRVPLQAILLADSFATHFRPISLEKPKVLLPLVNSPMIDYTLSWLESAGVEEVFVFCCAHSRQVIDYLKTSKWFQQPNFTVTTIESHNSTSAGDALRLVYERHVIRGDFVLVTGDTVSNMSLTQALKEHKDRRRKDSNAVMTMVIKRSKPSPLTRQSRLGTDELFMGIDHDTNQLMSYEDRADESRATLTIDKLLLVDNPTLSIHNDMQDCYIDICSPEVLSLFTDNFDYQHLRRHFVKGLLLDDIMGYKIFTHEIRSSYAARVENYRSYDTISKDIMQRWTYPLVPNIQFFGNRVNRLERQGMYRASDVELSRSAQIGPFTVIGSGTKIGNCSEVSNSVIGEGCTIGSNVSIEGCYIWNNVTIEDGCKLKHAIACDGVIMKSGSVLEAGAVLSFKVVIGSQFVVPAYSKVSLLLQPIKQDSDEELEYADNNSGITDFPSTSNTLDMLEEDSMSESSDSQLQPATEVGNGGIGFIWSVTEGGYEEEWRHSVAPIPADKIAEIIENATNEVELLNQDVDIQPPSGELEVEHNSVDTESDEKEVIDDFAHFQKEVEATFLRAVNENVKDEHVILEVNSLRLSYNLCGTDCVSALFYSVMKLALDTPHGSTIELLGIVSDVVKKWAKLLKYYLATIDDEIEVILKFEEMCLESSTAKYSAHFAEIMHLLYNIDLLQEEAIFNWASEKKGADESDRIFVKQAESFLKWLEEAPEESDEETD